MHRIWIAGIAALLGIAGSANLAAADLLSDNGAVIAPARDIAPDVLLKTVTLEVIAAIRQDKDIGPGNLSKVTELVEVRIVPLFDFPRMTQIAMARNWPLATPAQQKALTLEFKTLLVRTYSVVLSSYRDQGIEYKPLRAAPAAAEVTVRSQVRQSGGEAVTIDYDMEKTPAGWKVYDIRVSAVSLVITYRNTFAGMVRDSGIEGLIKALSDKNRQAALEAEQRALARVVRPSNR